MLTSRKLASVPEDVLLRALHLEKKIGGKVVLRDVSLEVGGQGALAILGPNGAGKTTLLRILSGVWGPTQGELWRFGQKVDKEGRSDPRIGYLGHQSFLYPTLSALDNLTFYAKLWGLDRPSVRAANALKQVGLTWSQTDPVKTYSRGMLQRAAIARVLLTQPKLLLLDEPYTGLDLAAQEFLDTTLRSFQAAGGAIILITHNVHEAIRIAQAVTILVRGRLVWWADTHGWNADQLAFEYQKWLGGGARHP
ncbi:MAG: heme ABC exporter ATP-binding protein CcmA [Sulfobacillus benefaciens]|uniref:Heme ABC exporter ATP-binding protein CcmA n=1 Tax=Sulfobacillus benefaciens TaxID=453960 RepID=A0A2T2XHS3_9FIRM|nr:MAG: heme ABC exporter ATP-binding protein CcmA [Sulfobacillus benefaciens]